jgi:hypothetical protein
MGYIYTAPIGIAPRMAESLCVSLGGMASGGPDEAATEEFRTRQRRPEMSHRIPYLLVLLAICPVVSGCDALVGLFGADTVTVRLVNDGDYDVVVEIYISDQQEIPEVLLTTLGTKLEYTVEAGETVTFSRSCDDLQAIIISDADLQVIGGIGPETSSDVLRDGDDFSCGDTIVFTFDHPDVPLDLDLTVEFEG